METVLVTGGAGFIGSHLTEALLGDGREVVVLDNLNDFYDPAVKRGNLAALAGKEGFSFVEGDIRDREATRKALARHGIDSIVHLAAMAGVRPSLERPAHYSDVNVTGTVANLPNEIVIHSIGKSCLHMGRITTPPHRPH